jgi:DNA-binding NarL/FixJ family response regulator
MTAGESLKVFIVEDHPIVRRGLIDVVRDHYDVVGSADSASSAI